MWSQNARGLGKNRMSQPRRPAKEKERKKGKAFTRKTVK